MNEIEELQKKRFDFLHLLYEKSGGSSSEIFKEWDDIGKKLGFTEKESDKIYQYLNGKGLIKVVAYGGAIVITHEGVVEIENGLKSLIKKDDKNMPESKIRLFISHSSRDSGFVQELVELLRAALSLPSSQIRCTSIDGYRLPGGANTDQQLKQEVHDADSFIGVISFDSIKSLYVVFELGARWGAGRSLIPLKAPGINANLLGGPLAGINALSSGNRSQLHQLISDLSNELGIKPEPPASYEHYINAIVKIREEPPTGGETSEGKNIKQITEKEVQILKLLADQGNHGMMADQIANRLNISVTKAEYYLDELHDKEMVYYPEEMGGGPEEYTLDQNGKKYLVENDLID